MQFPKHTLTALSIATLVALAGCGGSSSSNNNPNPVPDPGNGGGDTVQMQITGEAVKGVLKNAQATAYELNDQGERFESSIGTALTDDQGEYELALNDDYTGGLIEVEITAVEGETFMVCDAAQCGDVAKNDDVLMPSDFALRTIVEQEEDSDTIAASVTAWTTMAASRAQALLQSGTSASLKDARRQANAEVSQVTGFDISSARARGLSQLEGADSAQSQYALMNAAVAEIVFRANANGNLSAQLNRFTAGLDDGRLGNEDDGFSSSDLGQAISKVVTENADRVSAEASDALAQQSARLESAGEDGFDPDFDADLDIDDNADDAEKIAAYKTFMGQTRTWLSSMEELSSDELLNSVSIDEDTLRATVDADTQARFQFLGEVIGQVTSFSSENLSTLIGHLENGGSEAIDIKNGQGSTVGEAELTFADNDGLTISVTGTATGENGGAFVPFELELATSIPVDNFDIDHANNEVQAMRITRLLSDNVLAVNATVGDANSDHFLQLNDVSLSVAMSAAIESDANGDFDGDKAQSSLQSASFSGDVAINSGGYRFEGDAGFELVRLNSDARLFVDSEFEGGVLGIKSARLSGGFTSADDGIQFNASVNLNIHNAVSFDTFAWLDSADTTANYSGRLSDNDLTWLNGWVEDEVSNPDELTVSTWPDYSRVSAYSYGASYEEDIYFQRELTTTEQERVKAYAREKLEGLVAESVPYTFEYATFEHYDYASFWIARIVLSDVETASYNLQGSLTASLGITLPDLPAAQLTATFNRTGQYAGSIRANVDWDGGNYTLDVAGSNLDNPDALDLLFFNAQGYELSMAVSFAQGEVTELTGEATINGDAVGQVEWRDGQPVLVFQDGDETEIQSLF